MSQGSNASHSNSRAAAEGKEGKDTMDAAGTKPLAGVKSSSESLAKAAALEDNTPLALPVQTSRTGSQAKRQSTVTRRPVPEAESPHIGLGPTSEFSGSGYADTPAAADDEKEGSHDEETDNEEEEQEEQRPQSQLYEDIYEYYGDRQSHPYSQLTRESVYYSTDSVAKSSIKSSSPAPFSDAETERELEPVQEASVEESANLAGDSDAASANDSIEKTVQLITTVKSQDPDDTDELPTPDEQKRLEHEILHSFMTSGERRSSVDLDEADHENRSRSTSMTSRSSFIADSYDAEIAELYQGTTAFLDRPISVYQNVLPLHTKTEEESKAVDDTSEVATPKVESKPMFGAAESLPVQNLESGIDSLTLDTESSGVPQLNFIAASPTADNSDRPRWQPLEANDSNASSSTVVPGPSSGNDTSQEHNTSGDQSSLIKDLSLTGNMLDNVDQSFETTAEMDKTTTRDTSASSSSAHHTHNDSATSALSMISDNPDVVPPDLPSKSGHEVGTDMRDTSPSNPQQFSQISSKVKRPPPVDFSALLNGATSEARLTQLVNLRQREAEYESGLSVWLMATYSQLDGNSEVYTTGLPPENEGRSVSMTRQMTHISSEHLSSTKEALEHFGEKSTKKARSLFAKGRRLVKS